MSRIEIPNLTLMPRESYDLSERVVALNNLSLDERKSQLEADSELWAEYYRFFKNCQLIISAAVSGEYSLEEIHTLTGWSLKFIPSQNNAGVVQDMLVFYSGKFKVEHPFSYTPREINTLLSAVIRENAAWQLTSKTINVLDVNGIKSIPQFLAIDDRQLRSFSELGISTIRAIGKAQHWVRNSRRIAMELCKA